MENTEGDGHRRVVLVLLVMGGRPLLLRLPDDEDIDCDNSSEDPDSDPCAFPLPAFDVLLHFFLVVSCCLFALLPPLLIPAFFLLQFMPPL